jgi:NAD(P)H dehydrogenase (quinone)
MILITGANGHFGKATIQFLLEKGIHPSDISGLVREELKGTPLKEKGIKVKTGNYDDYGSLTEAFKGVDKLLLISGTDVPNRTRQHENVVKAAKEVGVKHIIYTSFERKNESETSPLGPVAASHMQTEKAIKESGMTYTIMRNNLYMDYLPVFLGEKVLEKGIFLPAGDTKTAYALRSDMAEAAANILTGNSHENREYYISNTEAVSFYDIAGILSDISGKKVTYANPDVKTFTDTLTDGGVSKDFIGFLLSFSEGIKQGEFLPDRTDLEKLLGRKPVTAKDFLSGIYGS